MQFHLNGFRPGDPDQSAAAGQADNEIDVLIVAADPADPTRITRNG